jgi:hypothetical protein
MFGNISVRAPSVEHALDEPFFARRHTHDRFARQVRSSNRAQLAGDVAAVVRRVFHVDQQPVVSRRARAPRPQLSLPSESQSPKSGSASARRCLRGFVKVLMPRTPRRCTRPQRQESEPAQRPDRSWCCGLGALRRSAVTGMSRSRWLSKRSYRDNNAAAEACRGRRLRHCWGLPRNCAAGGRLLAAQSRTTSAQQFGVS